MLNTIVTMIKIFESSTCCCIIITASVSVFLSLNSLRCFTAALAGAVNKLIVKRALTMSWTTAKYKILRKLKINIFVQFL